MMAGLLPGLSASFPESAFSTFQQPLTGSNDLSPLDANVPTTTAAPSAVPAVFPNTDQVTLSLQDRRLEAQLYTVMESQRRLVQEGGQLLEIQSSLSRAASLSVQTQVLQIAEGADDQDTSSLMRSMDERLTELNEGDPEQAQRLRILLKTLAKLNPNKDAASIFKKIYRGLSRVLDLPKLQQGQALALGRPPQVPNSPSLSGFELVHFELDFEMELTRESSIALASLDEEGIEAHAVRVESSRRVAIHIEFTGVRQDTRKSDPLILDLEGDGVQLTGVEDGQSFDIDGDGVTDRTAFVQGDDAFLALDRNHNARIDDGRELFGDQHGALNGFEELSSFDDNDDGVIDGRDRVFDSLRLLHDIDDDGEVENDELSRMGDHGIRSLALRYYQDMMDDEHGNTLAEHAEYVRENGRRGKMVEALLRYADDDADGDDDDQG